VHKIQFPWQAKAPINNYLINRSYLWRNSAKQKKKSRLSCKGTQKHGVQTFTGIGTNSQLEAEWSSGAARTTRGGWSVGRFCCRDVYIASGAISAADNWKLVTLPGWRHPKNVSAALALVIAGDAVGQTTFERVNEWPACPACVSAYYSLCARI